MMTTLVLAEPQCWGFEHARFNAALARTVNLAYPGARLILLAEPGHLDQARSISDRIDPPAQAAVEWRRLSIPRRRAKTLERLAQGLLTISTVLRTVRDEDASLLLLMAATETDLLLLKLLLRVFRLTCPALAVFHGMLASLSPQAPARRWASLRGLRLVFRLPHPTQLGYIALGSSIVQALTEVNPSVARYTAAMDIPFLWEKHDMPAAGGIQQHPLRFGFFGASGGRGKGFDAFATLARDVQATGLPVEFSVVGHLSTSGQYRRYASTFPGASATPHTAMEYGRLASGVTYAVSAGDPEVYHFVASTSFLDALSFVKPGIYLRNSYLEDCFHRMGDIGYLCNTIAEMKELMITLLKNFPTDRYLRQCETILRARRIFDPATVQAEFHQIAEQFRPATP